MTHRLIFHCLLSVSLSPSLSIFLQSSTIVSNLKNVKIHLNFLFTFNKWFNTLLSHLLDEQRRMRETREREEEEEEEKEREREEETKLGEESIINLNCYLNHNWSCIVVGSCCLITCSFKRFKGDKWFILSFKTKGEREKTKRETERKNKRKKCVFGRNEKVKLRLLPLLRMRKMSFSFIGNESFLSLPLSLSSLPFSFFLLVGRKSFQMIDSNLIYIQSVQLIHYRVISVHFVNVWFLSLSFFPFLSFILSPFFFLLFSHSKIVSLSDQV